jgi:hypothetical protein
MKRTRWIAIVLALGLNGVVPTPAALDAGSTLVLRDLYILAPRTLPAGRSVQCRAIALYVVSGTNQVVARDVTSDPPVPFALIPGDANLDGKVDLADLGALSANYGKTIDLNDPDSHPWSMGDFNLNGKVDLVDLGILSANYREAP